MKFELKTENDDYLKLFSNFIKTIFSLALIIIFLDLALKLGFISRNYQIEYNCKILAVDKSTTNFKKIYKLSKVKSKQRIWEFCKVFIK